MSEPFSFKCRPDYTNELMELAVNCYVSYNENPCKGSVFRSDTGAAETALVIDNKFFILNGDYRDEYREAANNDVSKCLDVYSNHIEHRSSWSNDAPVEDLLAHLLTNTNTTEEK